MAFMVGQDMCQGICCFHVHTPWLVLEMANEIMTGYNECGFRIAQEVEKMRMAVTNVVSKH